MSLKITSKDFAFAAQKIIDDYAADVEKSITEVKEDLSKLGVKRLKLVSPKKRGDYARSWTVRKKKDYYLIYNKQGQLTHLLEYGHPLVNKKGEVYGHAKAYPHIKETETFILDAAQEVLEKRLGGN